MHDPDRRIIVHFNRDSGDWNAWLAGHPQHAFGGDSSATALARFLDKCGWSDLQVVADEYASSLDGAHFEFIVRHAGPKQTCPDCGGSGKYVGLHAVETCRRCGGRKVIPG
jgi:hypothetical protein